jgi:hypothetical protein
MPADGAKTAEGSAADDCANCGGPGDGLEEVRRVYVTVDEHGRVTGSETMADRERWCLSCRSLYPHLPEGHEPEDRAPDAGDPSPAGG